jgi:N-methylhydantoinase B
MNDLIDHGEHLMRAIITAIPDGGYRFEDVLDDDGFGTEAIPIVAAIIVAGDHVAVDFAGTAPACEGSVNAVEAITLSAVRYCFLCLMATRWEGSPEGTDEPPLNAGCFRPIEVIAPPGTVVNADPPHAVAAGNVETSQRIVDVVLGALAQALPDVIPAASQGTMNNLTLGGRHPESGQPYAFYETIAGGTGGGPTAPGLDGAHAHMTNTWNTPVEALEFAYPFRVERYAIRDGSGGDGQHRGGAGLCREMRVLGRAQGTLIAERRRSRPYGLAGGEPGEPGEDMLLRDGEIRPLDAKAALDLEAGDVIRVCTPGGGGWGRLVV